MRASRGVLLGIAIGAVIWMAAAWLFWPKAGGFSPDLPPKKYQGDARLRVHFTDHAKPLCGIVKAERGSIACAGVGSDWAIMPNPCAWRDPYAKMMCHELGHALGWPAEHPR